jgi:hypothetical protein
MQRTIAQFELGSTCNVLDPVAFANAIPARLDAANGFTTSEAARRFAAFHSARNFTLHGTARLRERLGLPADQAVLSWDWVLSALSPQSPP